MSLREIAAELERAGHVNEHGMRYSAASGQHMPAQRGLMTSPARKTFRVQERYSPSYL